MSTDTALTELRERFRQLRILQELYAGFLPFLDEAMRVQGYPPPTAVMKDIAQFMVYGPQRVMVQAQRGQTKTSIAAAFSVWSLIHNPANRVLVISAGGKLSSQISSIMIDLLYAMPFLACLRPGNGDRASITSFDIHRDLKGIDKSPSISAMGMGSTSTGSRADLVVADDAESFEDSHTAAARALLKARIEQLNALNTTGRMVWLGTPQSRNSVYNDFPSMGVVVRIWPGRYPTVEEEAHYGEFLAPYLRDRMRQDPSLQTGGGALGNRGQVIEPGDWLGEATHQDKELSMTSSYTLQFLLNTSLVDSERYPLKSENLVLLDVVDRGPLQVTRNMDIKSAMPYLNNGYHFKIRPPQHVSPEVGDWQGVMVYVDPAGGGANADETAYAITAFLNSNIYLLEIGAIPGGYDIETRMKPLAKRIAKWSPNLAKIEKNFGFGAFREVFIPILHQEHVCAVEDDMVTGQKEVRIIKTLEPAIGRGLLVITPNAIKQDLMDCERYDQAKRQLYSLFFQMNMVTSERGALVHDDRLDALEGAVRHWQNYVAIDQAKKVGKLRDEAILRDMKFLDPPKNAYPQTRVGSVIDQYLRN